MRPPSTLYLRHCTGPATKYRSLYSSVRVIDTPNCLPRVSSLADISELGTRDATTVFPVTHFNQPRVCHAFPIEPHHRPILHGGPPGGWFKSLYGSLPPIDYSLFLVPPHKVHLLSLLSVKLTYLPKTLLTGGQWLIHKLQRTSSLWKRCIEPPYGSDMTRLSLLSATKIVLILLRHTGYSVARV